MTTTWFDTILSVLHQGTLTHRKATARALADKLTQEFGTLRPSEMCGEFWSHVQAVSEEAAFQNRLWLKSRTGHTGRPRGYRPLSLPAAYACLLPAESEENCSDTQTDLNKNAVMEALDVVCCLYAKSMPVVGLGDVVLLNGVFSDPVMLCLPVPTPTSGQLKKDLKDAARSAYKVDDDHLPWLAVAHLVNKGYAVREISAQVEWPA